MSSAAPCPPASSSRRSSSITSPTRCAVYIFLSLLVKKLNKQIILDLRLVPDLKSIKQRRIRYTDFFLLTILPEYCLYSIVCGYGSLYVIVRKVVIKKFSLWFSFKVFQKNRFWSKTLWICNPGYIIYLVESTFYCVKATTVS